MTRSLAVMHTPKYKSSEKYDLCDMCSLRGFGAALLKTPCAYGGLMSGTVHVLRFLHSFSLSWLSCEPPRFDMISGALFFMAVTLHRMATSVDPTMIYQNISTAHL